MREHVVNRPEEAAMQRLLEQVAGPEEVVLRLAWQAGLTRDEISALTWEQVSFSDGRLELPERTIPLEDGLHTVLWRLYEADHEASPRVALSSRGKKPLQPESISRLARQALDRAGQANVRLIDLRHDWIIRQLEHQDWAAVARISGVNITTLQIRFSEYVKKERAAQQKPAGGIDEFRLWRVLQTERNSPEGLTLWLVWQLGLQVNEVIELTWEQVDLAKGVLRLSNRDVLLTNAVRRLLEDTYKTRTAADDPHVVLTENSRKPLDQPRISRMVRAVLIRGGMEQVRLRDLRRDENREDGDRCILEAVGAQGALSRGAVMKLLGVSTTAAHARLRRLVEEQKLVRIGAKYYLAGTAVPEEQHLDVIQSYLLETGFAYRQDIAKLLGIQPKQCTLVLRRMVKAGELFQTGQKYYLPQGKERKAE